VAFETADDDTHPIREKSSSSPRAFSSISNGGEGDQSMVQARLINGRINRND
jgi:hypothetical protein